MRTVQITEFTKEHEAAFRELNLEWIEKYFEVEPSDLNVLNDPFTHIISKGGAILMAALNGEAVGTCALIRHDDHTYELAKMAVSPKAQGRQVGYTLAKAVIEKARTLKAAKIFLLSNRTLAPAIHLYKKLGFKEVPLDSKEYKRSDIKMELTL